MIRSLIAAVSCLSLCCLPLAPAAWAQNDIVIHRAMGAAPKPRTVTMTFQLALPAPPVAGAADMTNAMAAASQSLFDIVNRECDVLSASLKGSCRLVHLNSGGSINDPSAAPPFAYHPAGEPVVTASATATFELGAPAEGTAPVAKP